MTLVEFAATVSAALLIGGLIGAIGIGGVLLTPWLTHVVGLPVREAIVISSFAFIGTGLAALATASRALPGLAGANRQVMAAALLGALLGAMALAVVPSRLSLALLAVLTVSVGVRALLGNRTEAAGSGFAAAPNPPGSPNILDSATWRPGAGVGAITGFASALTGTGGPMVMMPILLWQGMAVREAILLGQAVQLPIALTASAANFILGGIDLLAGTAIGLMLVPGAYLGHRLACHVPLTALTRLVGLTLITAGVGFGCKAAT